jgi:hypothetical protein
MRPWTAGQKRFSFLFSQMAQLTNQAPETLSHATGGMLWGGAEVFQLARCRPIKMIAKKSNRRKARYLWAFQVPK